MTTNLVESESDAQAIEEEERRLRVSLGEEGASAIELFKLGLEAEEHGRTALGRAMYSECIDTIQECFDTFLAAAPSQLGSDAMQDLHKRANIAVGMLDMIQKYVEGGRSAEAVLLGKHEPDDGKEQSH